MQPVLLGKTKHLFRGKPGEQHSRQQVSQGFAMQYTGIEKRKDSQCHLEDNAGGNCSFLCSTNNPPEIFQSLLASYDPTQVNGYLRSLRCCVRSSEDLGVFSGWGETRCETVSYKRPQRKGYCSYHLPLLFQDEWLRCPFPEAQGFIMR